MGEFTGPCVSSTSKDFSTISSQAVSDTTGTSFDTTEVMLPSSVIAVTTLADPFLVNAYAVSIRWQSIDFTTSISALSRETSIAQTTPTNVSGLSTANHSALGNEAKVAIGLGVSLGVLLILIVALSLFCFRRRRSQLAAQEHDEDPDEGSASPTKGDLEPAELPTPTFFTPELPSDGFKWKTAELYG